MIRADRHGHNRSVRGRRRGVYTTPPRMAGVITPRFGGLDVGEDEQSPRRLPI